MSSESESFLPDNFEQIKTLQNGWVLCKDEELWFAAKDGGGPYVKFANDLGEVESYRLEKLPPEEELPNFETKRLAEVAYQSAMAPDQSEGDITTPKEESNVVDTREEEEIEDTEEIVVSDTSDLNTDEEPVYEEDFLKHSEYTGVGFVDRRLNGFVSFVYDVRVGSDDPVDNSSVSELYPTVIDKVRRARAGDEEAQEDVEDMTNRVKHTFSRGQPGWRDVVDSVMASTIVFSGVILLFSILTQDPTSETYELLTIPTRYGDLFLLTTILLGIVMGGFWIGRRRSVKGRIRTGSRRLLAVLQIIPVSVAVLIGISFGRGSGEVFEGVQSRWDSLEAQLVQEAPPEVAGLREFYLENTAILSVRSAAVMMLALGILVSIPFARRVVVRALNAAATDKEEFWAFDTSEQESVLTLVSDDDEEEEDEGEFKLGAFDRKEIDEQIKELIQLPEELTSSPYNRYREVTRYWVRAPYAYVSIVKNDAQNDYRYVVREPELEESEEIIREEFDTRLGPELLFEDIGEAYSQDEKKEEKVRRLEEKLVDLAEEYGIDAGSLRFHKVLYYIQRDYVNYSNIDPIMEDPYVEDISNDGDNEYIFVFHMDYKDLLSNVRFERDELRSFIRQIAQRSGEHISAANPMVDASLPDGSRAQLTLGSDITTRGSTFTIRLFKDIPFTPIDLLSKKTFSISQMAYLWLSIEHDRSLIFAGGTASGKTTSMNAVSLFIPPKAKVITLEDTREISLPHKNWIPGTTRDSVGAAGGDDIGMYELLRSALRQRPEYLIVGEIRGEEARTLFQAMSTGHTTYSTMHADTVQKAIGRLTNPPINVPRQMIEALDIMCIQQQVRLADDNDEVQNVRRNIEIRELMELRESGQFRTHPSYTRDAERDEWVANLNDSNVLEEVQREQGWERDTLRKELENRQKVLNYLLDNDITDFELVSRTIQSYMIDSEQVIQQIEDETLDPGKLRDLTELTFKEEGMVLSESERRKLMDDTAGELPASIENRTTTGD